MILRRDLPSGVLVAQTIHAAGESSPGNLPPSTYAIALAVQNEQALLAVEERLRAAGVVLTSIREPDPPYHGSLMALGLHPAPKSHLKKHLSMLPLLR